MKTRGREFLGKLISKDVSHVHEEGPAEYIKLHIIKRFCTEKSRITVKKFEKMRCSLILKGIGGALTL